MPEFQIRRFFRRNTRLLLLISVTSITLYTITLQFSVTHLSRPPSTSVTRPETSSLSYYCDRKTAKMSDSCLCYYNHERASSDATSNVTSGRSGVKCLMTIFASGRLGNAIGQYAALLVLSKLNNRPGFMSPRLWTALKDYFHLSLPVLSKQLYRGLTWNYEWINDEFEESYAQLPGLFLMVQGYVSSVTFFKGFEDQIKREFRFKDEIQQRAEKVLRSIAAKRTSVTFVGVHVRRGDYTIVMKETYNGVLADRKYFAQATDHFRKRFDDAVFVVVSDDMEWCVENIGNERNDVVFVGNGNWSDPIVDFAILVNCNHSVITIGTFGFFGAWFAGGDTVYLTNFTSNGSLWNKLFHADTAYPSHWHPIAASDFNPFEFNDSRLTT